jgi:hypothetical protein
MMRSMKASASLLGVFGGFTTNYGTARVTDGFHTVGCTVRVSTRHVDKDSRARKMKFTIGYERRVILGFQTTENTMAPGKLAKYVHSRVVALGDNAPAKVDASQGMPRLRGSVRVVRSGYKEHVTERARCRSISSGGKTNEEANQVGHDMVREGESTRRRED